MPVSILTIDVQDDAFKKFQAEFARYQAALAQMPGMWGKVGQAANAATTTAANAAAAARVNPWVQPQPAGAARAARPGAGTGGVYGTIRGFVRSVATAVGAGAAGGAGGPPGPPAPPAPPGQPPAPAGGPGPTRRAVLEIERFGRAASSVKRDMYDTAKHTLAISKNIAQTTYALMKWAGLALIGGGLLGGGGLFGLSRLADNASNTRRTAQGLGLSTGEYRAFGLNYSRAFDTDSVLGNIAHAKSTAADRWVFGSMGVDERKNPADLAIDTAIAAKKIFEQGGQSMDYAKARGLDKIYSEDDLRRLHALSIQELEDMRRRHYADARQFKISDEVSLQWQNLKSQLERSGITIETVLIRKLAPLAGPLQNLSDAFVHAVEKLLDTDMLTKAINAVSKGITQFADYLVSPQFKSDLDVFMLHVHDFANGVGDMIGSVAGFVKGVSGFIDDNPWLFSTKYSITPAGNFIKGELPKDPDEKNYTWADRWIGGYGTRSYAWAMKLKKDEADALAAGLPWPPASAANDNAAGTTANNVGNMKVPGSETQFQKFGTQAEGVRGMVAQLRLYQNRDKLDTIAGIVNKYAPPSQNDTRGYTDFVASRSGYGKDDKLNLNDDSVVAKIVAAMTRMEGKPVTAATVYLDIHNSTGSDVSVTSGAAAVQR